MDCADGSDEIRALCILMMWVILSVTLISVNSLNSLQSVGNKNMENKIWIETRNTPDVTILCSFATQNIFVSIAKISN